MTRDTLAEQVVDGYLQLLAGWSGDLHWTWGIVDGLVREKPDVAWPILLELIARVPDGNLGSLAAGPLEDFLSEHGPRVIDALEVEAATNLRLRQALAMVWKLGMTDEVWQRVQALADSSLADALEREPPTGWSANRIEVREARMPDITAGAFSEQGAEWLVAALRAAKPDGPEAWGTAVGVDLRLWTGAEPLPIAPVDMLAQVVALLETGGIVTDRTLIREARISDSRGDQTELYLEVRRMDEGQVEAMDSTASFEEEIGAMDIEEMQAQLEAFRAQMEAELAGKPLRFDQS